MYKNILFDIQGVMISFDEKNYLMQLLCNERAENECYDIVFGSAEWKCLEAGTLSWEQAVAIMSRKAAEKGRLFEVQAIVDDWKQMLRPSHRIMELMRRLRRKGYHIFYLGNITQDTLQYMNDKRMLFYCDGGIASCEAGYRLPDARIFTDLEHRYELDAAECICVSVNKTCIEQAFSLGITAIHYHTPTMLRRALYSCGVET